MNDSLFSGPKFNQKILGIIVRFSTYRIALAADVEKAVFQFLTKTDAERFLLVDDVEKDSHVTMNLQFTRVVFGVNTSPLIFSLTLP